MFNKDKIIELIEKNGWTKYRLAKEANLGQSTVHEILSGKKKNPNSSTITKLSEALNVDVNYFFDDEDYNPDSSDTNSTVSDKSLNKKDEKDIEKALSATLEQLESAQDGLMFDGEILDDETRELLRSSLENSMKMAKMIAKAKYTPNKYKK